MSIRQALTILLPLITPTLVYFIWMRFWGRTANTEEETVRRTTPWLRLGAAGLVLTALTLMVTGLLGRMPDVRHNYDYIPPHMENGELIQGQIQKKQQ